MARNYLLSVFLSDERFTHALFLGSDLSFEPEQFFGCSILMRILSPLSILIAKQEMRFSMLCIKQMEASQTVLQYKKYLPVLKIFTDNLYE